MKFFSEYLNKFFDSAESCVEAETTAKKKAEEEAKVQEEKQKLIKEKESAISKDKKILSGEIEAAEKNLEAVYAHYDAVKEECAKILEKSNKEILEKLNPAKDAVKEAQKRKFEAVSRFNKKYGTYTTTYTGAKAYDEFKRMNSLINDFFNFWNI